MISGHTISSVLIVIMFSQHGVYVIRCSNETIITLFCNRANLIFMMYKVNFKTS